MEGLGFKSVSTLASFNNITSREEFRSTEVGSTLISKTSLDEWNQEHCDDGILFIQSDVTFFKSYYTTITAINCQPKLIFVCTDTSFYTADGFRLSHAQVGGVTDGEWTYYTEGLSSFRIPSTSVSRVLGHLLSTTESASTKKLLSKATSPPLSNQSLVPWCNKSIHVETNSVFVKNELVKRVLSYKEWMNVYDIELLTQERMLQLQRNNPDVKPSMSFIFQVPVKLLRSLTSNMVKDSLDVNSPQDDDASISSIDSDSTYIKSNTLINNYENDSQSVTSLDDQSLAGELDNSRSFDSAARPDDAEAEVEDWDRWSVTSFEPITNIVPLVCDGDYDPAGHTRLFNAFRDLLIRKYRLNLMRSFLKYLRCKHSKLLSQTYKLKIDDRLIEVAHWVKDIRSTSKKGGRYLDLRRDLDVGKDAIRRAAWSTWWDWSAGSTIYFWRWPSTVIRSVRDGTKLFVDWDKMPRYMKKQNWPKDEIEKEKMEAKIRKVRERQYVQPGFVKSLTGFFAVPKAGTDIRLVYDATKCGLNDALWAPNFFLPTVDSILRNASETSWFGDIDLGEMFLNYHLDLDLQPYAGIDVTELDKTNTFRKMIRVFERWTRTLMGFKPCPYICTQTFAWGEEVIVGDRRDVKNPFHWDKVVLNLPGSHDYNPRMSIVYKWNSAANCMAAFFGTYVDDIRSLASTELACRSTTHQIASRINYLGQQDAVRKRGHASKFPRAWAGAKCVATEESGLYVLTTEKKWEKAKGIVDKWIELLAKLDQDENDKAGLEYNEMERDVGFLCHLSRTYPSTFP